MNQTAVEWLESEIKKIRNIVPKMLFEQAKQMEKENAVKKFTDGYNQCLEENKDYRFTIEHVKKLIIKIKTSVHIQPDDFDDCKISFFYSDEELIDFLLKDSQISKK